MAFRLLLLHPIFHRLQRTSIIFKIITYSFSTYKLERTVTVLWVYTTKHS
jgi:hypothetical protein